ncbi:MAG TPA: S-adenosyl-l-methionine hydroxide adenosyltransferase family protein [Synergistales bacterium]|nr:S-adenosyl-l-methionine hydroxide adenosyltransferase family protein [Synergistales bacterium]
MKKRVLCTTVVLLFLLLFANAASAKTALVFQTDFGLKDGAVSAMKGVAFGVDAGLPMFDLTHEISPYSIWEAAYRLHQTMEFWPAGTVFVSVVDPGVGTERASVVALTKDGRYIVTPDNGTLTFIVETPGIVAVRTIDDARHRLAGSEQSYTFFGRDLYAYTGAKLAAGAITFEEVGPLFEGEIVRIPYRKAEVKEGAVFGNIPVLDIQYGNVWSSIGKALFDELKPRIGANFDVAIFRGEEKVFGGVIPYVNTFGDVPEGKPLLYFNSLMNLSLALNMDSFAETHGIESGPEWSLSVRPAE